MGEPFYIRRLRDSIPRHQEGAAYISAVARKAYNDGDYPKAKWYQLEAAAEYRSARGLLETLGKELAGRR